MKTAKLISALAVLLCATSCGLSLIKLEPGAETVEVSDLPPTSEMGCKQLQRVAWNSPQNAYTKKEVFHQSAINSLRNQGRLIGANRIWIVQASNMVVVGNEDYVLGVSFAGIAYKCSGSGEVSAAAPSSVAPSPNEIQVSMDPPKPGCQYLGEREIDENGPHSDQASRVATNSFRDEARKIKGNYVRIEQIKIGSANSNAAPKLTFIGQIYYCK